LCTLTSFALLTQIFFKKNIYLNLQPCPFNLYFWFPKPTQKVISQCLCKTKEKETNEVTLVKEVDGMKCHVANMYMLMPTSCHKLAQDSVRKGRWGAAHDNVRSSRLDRLYTLCTWNWCPYYCVQVSLEPHSSHTLNKKIHIYIYIYIYIYISVG